MDAVKFLEELKRMCKSCSDCRSCPIKDPVVCMFCDAIDTKIDCNDFSKSVAIVETWSDEHPVKTRLVDFLEKFPNASLSSEGLPLWLPRPFGYCGRKTCYDCEQPCDAEGCWNLPLEE